MARARWRSVNASKGSSAAKEKWGAAQASLAAIWLEGRSSFSHPVSIDTISNISLDEDFGEGKRSLRPACCHLAESLSDLRCKTQRERRGIRARCRLVEDEEGVAILKHSCLGHRRSQIVEHTSCSAASLRLLHLCSAKCATVSWSSFDDCHASRPPSWLLKRSCGRRISASRR